MESILQKQYRVFRLIQLLSSKPKKTVAQLKKILECGNSSIYRYLDLLELLGYQIDKNEYHQYFLFDPSDTIKANFNIEEIELIMGFTAALPESHPLKNSIKAKIYDHSPLLPLVDELINKALADHIHKINTAITDRKCIILKNYHSLQSDTIEDRLVEPHQLIASKCQLVAYEIESNQIKHYKINRIDKVELTSNDCNHHNIGDPYDIFGFAGKVAIPVKLELDKRAYQLLIEEYSDAKHYCKQSKNGDTYIFKYEVRNVKGIARFVLGLINHVKAIDSPELVAEIKERLEKCPFPVVGKKE
jgi:proteasome accessory factor C